MPKWALGFALLAAVSVAQVLPAQSAAGTEQLAVAGSVQVQLHPTEAVSAGTQQLVTFGLPLPRGTLTEAELGTVRVLKGTTEIAAHVAQLTPWRHPTDPGQDGTSVRVARVQFAYTFAAPASESITVSWGGQARTQNRPAAEVRSGWHKLVGDGKTPTGGPTYGTSHNVWEPNVYAVLPKAWLTTSGLKSALAPLDDAVGEQRVKPADIAASYPGYREAEHALVNFFYTTVNNDDPLTGPVNVPENTNPFLTVDEPWLYDRAGSYHTTYLRSGYLTLLREAIRNTDFYQQQLWKGSDCNNGRCTGSFKFTNPNAAASWHDQKYSYNEPLALSYWLTGGDPALLAKIEDVSKVFDDVLDAPNGHAFFTERHAAFKLMANTVAYEVTGKAEYRDKITAQLGALRNAQLNPYGGGAVDGGIWHSLMSHEGDSIEQGGALPIVSPWMSALLVEALARTHFVTGSSTATALISGLADHTCGVGSYMTSIRDGYNPLSSQSGGQHLLFPHYLSTRDGLGYAKDFNPENDHEHAYAAATSALWGSYLAKQAGDTAKSTSLRQCGEKLYVTFSHGITYWTRPAAPASNSDAYRLRPSRKYNWWFKNSTGFQWLARSLPL